MQNICSNYSIFKFILVFISVIIINTKVTKTNNCFLLIFIKTLIKIMIFFIKLKVKIKIGNFIYGFFNY